MTTRNGFCGKHQHDIKQRLHHLGLWSKVKAVDTETTIDIGNAWMAGLLRRDMICPLIVLMLEIQAKANRMAEKMAGVKGVRVATCPCCSIVRMSNDESADVKVIHGLADTVLGLMQSNGLAGGTPAAALSMVKQPDAQLLVTRNAH